MDNTGDSMTTHDDALQTFDLDGLLNREPELSSDAARSFENAAVIGDEKLRSSGYFVNIVKRAPGPAFDGTTPNILIVEDDPGTVLVIGGILKSKGMATRSAGSLQEIIRAMNAQPRPDLILLDIMLPDANGFAILERLRRHPELNSIPVIMLTSLSDPADVAKGLALGATGYMTKPARPPALLSAIDVVLGINRPA
jgi:two-component system, OmpR family, response regulator